MGIHAGAQPLMRVAMPGGIRGCLRMALGAGFLLLVAACGDFLSGPGISEDPNKILTLSKPGPLYVAIQQTAGWQQEGGPFAAFMQQIAGVSRGAAQVDAYIVGADFGGLYGAGGLVDIRKMEQLARKVHDSLYIGLAKVYQTIDVGLAADFWGDVPYREAADSTNLQPHYDPQLQVYADLQAQLDSAINLFLVASGPSNVGGALDNSELVYGGRTSPELRSVYRAVARSLKARFFMHVAAAGAAGMSGAPASPYDSALRYATKGIGSAADDMLWFHDASAAGKNIWWQSFGPGSDWQPGAAIIEIMNRRILAGVEDAQRRDFYFTPASDGAYHGFRPTGAPVTTSGGIYAGSGPYSGFGAFLDPNVSDGSFRQPVITYAETQLIAAEAAWHLNCSGCQPTVVVPAAQPFLDAARSNRRYGSTTFGNAPGTLPASLQSIIEEKYITLFLNPEVWNDWKRTCLPSLAPALGKPTIPGRLLYGISEVTANPNTPANPPTGRNPNQPTPCPALNYTDSSPLAN
jgi:Starch-binding associating with outer membrane